MCCHQGSDQLFTFWVAPPDRAGLLRCVSHRIKTWKFNHLWIPPGKARSHPNRVGTIVCRTGRIP